MVKEFRRYPGREYASGHQDIFDTVDIDMFTVVALNMMVVKLGYTGESEPLFYIYLRPLTILDEGLYALACEEDCLATIVRSFKLIEVYIEHGVTALDCYIRPPRFRTTIKDISDESGSIATNRTEKIPYKVSVCDSITPSQVINDVMRQLSFKDTKLDGKAGFANSARSGVECFGLSHDESFRVDDDLDLNLNEPISLNRSEEVGTQKFTVEDVVLKDYVSSREDVKHYNDQEDESTPSDGHMDLSFDNIGVTNLVPDDVLEGEDVDIINSDGFENDPGNDDETNDNRRRRRRARCDGKVPIFIMSQAPGPTGPSRRMKARPNGSSGPTTRSKKGRIHGWCRQAYKDLLWRVASATSVKEFGKCMLELKTMNPKAHESLLKYGFESSGGTTPRSVGKSLLLVDYMEGNILSQGLSVTGGVGGAGGVGVSSQGLSHTRWTKRRVQTERISPQKRTLTQPASQPSTSSQVSGLGCGGYLRDYVRVVAGTNDEGKQSGDLVEMPSEAVKHEMDDYVPDEIDGAKCEQVLNHVINKGNLENLVCKQVANHGGYELVDKGRPLKRKMLLAEPPSASSCRNKQTVDLATGLNLLRA
uniref:Uncharacterized protein n=1 Tax=Tanacetum cinerariifolium TaxID=118510 RepID=A0A6L2NHY0_TANCI|nr:hypothetical protein [Tanacetum cinerariifolium]